MTTAVRPRPFGRMLAWVFAVVLSGGAERATMYGDSSWVERERSAMGYDKRP